MSLSSQRHHPKVVWLSLSRFYEYHYTTINQVIRDLSAEDINELYKLMNELIDLPKYENQYRIFQGDTTSTFHPYSACLEDRGYVYNAMEQIPFQKKIGIGYRYSYINVSGRSDLSSPHWAMPCSIHRVNTTASSEVVLLKQLQELLLRGFLSNTHLNVLTLDSGYGNAKYLGKLREQPSELTDNLVSIVALRRNRKVWSSYKGEYSGRGAPQVYGQKYYLNDNTSASSVSNQLDKIGLGSQPTSKQVIISYTTQKGKNYDIELSLWEDMKLCTAHGVDMKPVSFAVVRIRRINPETGELKGRPLWLAVHGKRKNEIIHGHLADVFKIYKCRFDIEHYFRFGKQKLLINDYQTPEVKHAEKWHHMAAIAYWFLFAASKEVEIVNMPWEKQCEVNEVKNEQHGKHEQRRKTPCQTHKAMEGFISSLEKINHTPKTRNKGKGRQKDTILTKRKKYPVVKKKKKQANNSS